MAKKFAAAVIAASLLSISAAVSIAAGDRGKARPGLDLAGAGDEAVSLLTQYLKLDTTVPPGNEKIGAEFLASVFRANGMEASLYETAPNRSCVFSVLKGTGRKRPLVLLNHIDVVPAAQADWKHPPFGGEIHEGEIWGRGTLDMKGMGIAQLETMLMLKRSGKKLDRDIIYLATPDEEVGGEFGAKWFCKNHPELLKGAEFLINEGFHIDTDNAGKPRYWGVNVGEKNVLWLKLTARGDAGHASMPIADSATNRLVSSVSRIVNAPPKPIVLPAVQEYFKEISRTATGWQKEAYANIDESVKNPDTLKRLLSDKMKSSMLRNTASLTVLKAGYKTNVIPAEASAEIDCRLLPGVKHDSFINEIKQLAGDPSIDFSILEWEHTDSSAYDTECFAAIKAVAAEDAPGVPVVPVIVPWFTDSHWFRELGIICYGFEPFQIDDEHIATMHGKDERVPVQAFKDGVVRLYKIVEKLAVSP